MREFGVWGLERGEGGRGGGGGSVSVWVADTENSQAEFRGGDGGRGDGCSGCALGRGDGCSGCGMW